MSPDHDPRSGSPETLETTPPVARPEPPPPPVGWMEIGGPADLAPAAGPDSTVYLHALRRCWLLAIVLGMLCGAPAAVVVWRSYVPRYTASCLLHIASQEQPILFTTAERITAFEIYKSTQAQYLTSRFVLTAAMRKPGVAQMASLRQSADPVEALASRVSVAFPGGGEIMTVGLRSEEPREAAALVNAVVDAYLEEVVNVELKQRRERLVELDRIYTDKESELRRKRTELRQLAERLGTGDSQTLTLKQQLTLQQFAEYRKQLVQVQMDLMHARGKLQVAQATCQVCLVIGERLRDVMLGSTPCHATDSPGCGGFPRRTSRRGWLAQHQGALGSGRQE